MRQVEGLHVLTKISIREDYVYLLKIVLHVYMKRTLQRESCVYVRVLKVLDADTFMTRIRLTEAIKIRKIKKLCSSSAALK